MCGPDPATSASRLPFAGPVAVRLLRAAIFLAILAAPARAWAIDELGVLTRAGRVRALSAAEAGRGSPRRRPYGAPGLRRPPRGAGRRPRRRPRPARSAPGRPRPGARRVRDPARPARQTPPRPAPAQRLRGRTHRAGRSRAP